MPMGDSRLGAALDFSWMHMDFAKTAPSAPVSPGKGNTNMALCPHLKNPFSLHFYISSDESSSSQASSRTPSPFGFPSGASGSGGQSSETYSRKVFVGGLPPDIDQGIGCCVIPVGYDFLSYVQCIYSCEGITSLRSTDEIKEHFVRFGPLTVDWPHKAQSKAYFPPKGICVYNIHTSLPRVLELSLK